MPRSILRVKDVAATLHLSIREVIRLAEHGILPGLRVRGEWQFRTGDIWNWIEANLESLPARRAKDRHPASAVDLLLEPVLKECCIGVDVPARTKASIIRELAALAVAADESIDRAALAEAISEREKAGSTALQDGVAIPHPARPTYAEGPVLAAARTAQGIAYGERGGRLTDLFFLICCPTQTEHLLYLGRLCRLLVDPALQRALRAAENPREFLDAIVSAERTLCAQR